MIETWRRLALYLLLLGSAGVAGELVLLEHYEDPWQWAPITLLGLALLLGVPPRRDERGDPAHPGRGRSKYVDADEVQRLARYVAIR